MPSIFPVTVFPSCLFDLKYHWISRLHARKRSQRVNERISPRPAPKTQTTVTICHLEDRTPLASSSVGVETEAACYATSEARIKGSS
jgi:hypothetical protein